MDGWMIVVAATVWCGGIMYLLHRSHQKMRESPIVFGSPAWCEEMKRQRYEFAEKMGIE